MCRRTYSYKSPLRPYDEDVKQWPFKLMPGTEPKASSGRQTGLALRQRVRSQCDFVLHLFFAEGINEYPLHPRHASPVSTHIVETDHPHYSFIKKRSASDSREPDMKVICLILLSVPTGPITTGLSSLHPAGFFAKSVAANLLRSYFPHNLQRTSGTRWNRSQIPCSDLSLLR